MKSTQNIKTINELVELKSNKMLAVNPEYQRGAVWNKTQQRKLIDSVFRGYPLPLIYLHHIKKQVAGMSREDLEIIDGQQRLNALSDFREGAFSLFDPIADDRTARFPAFIKAQPCPWAGKKFETLSDQLRQQFLTTPLNVAMIETDQINEVRDLFVRLQSGLALNHQETRDAWPGQFTEFVLRLGGKPDVPRYPGHAFFTRVLKMKPASDRGKTRQLAAQLSMLFFTRRKFGADTFCDINAEGINDFYYSNLDFDLNSSEAGRLREVLSRLEQVLSVANLPKLHGHDAIHALLLVDSLYDDYTLSWADRFAEALDKFNKELNESKKKAASMEAAGEFWTHYGQWTRVNSDRGEIIARRHRFYVRKMSEYLAPLQTKDPQRLFGEVEKASLFYSQEKKCAVCNSALSWNESEVHHVQQHSDGGPTILANAALVHKTCHPKGSIRTDAFSSRFKAATS